MWTQIEIGNLLSKLPTSETAHPQDGEKRLVLWLSFFGQYLEILEAEAVVQGDYLGWYASCGNAVNGYTADDDCVIGFWSAPTVEELAAQWDWASFPDLLSGEIEPSEGGQITKGSQTCYVLKENGASYLISLGLPYREDLLDPESWGSEFSDLYGWVLDGGKIWWDHHYHPVHLDEQVVRAWCAV